MNILVISLAGDGMVFQQRFREEGHEAIYYVHDPASRSRGKGLVFQTEDPDKIAEQADIILFDDNGLGEMADRYRKKGYLVWNGGSFNDRLEHDRLFGMEVFREHGIPIPETWEVSSADDVKNVLSSEFGKKEKLVIKLDGEDKAGSSFTFTAKDPAECLSQVEHWEEDHLLGSKWSGIIQRFVKGVEVSTEAWYAPETGFTTHNITLEEKKLLAGNHGQSVGCSFNTIVRIDEDSKLFKMVLAPIEPLLKKQGFVGQIDANAIVDEAGVPHALEFSPRCGYDATPTLAWANNHGFGSKIGMILGVLPIEERLFGYRDTIWAGVRLYVPPYPFECKSEELAHKVYQTCAGVPILGHEELAEDLWLYDACKVDGEFCMAGTSGIVGIAFGSGDTVAEAGERAYAVADRLHVPNKSYRALDGYKRGEEALSFLFEKRLIKFYRKLRSLAV